MTDAELAKLREALLELRATVLATLTTPRAVAWLFAIGVAVALGVWAIAEAVAAW